MTTYNLVPKLQMHTTPTEDRMEEFLHTDEMKGCMS